jgi:hypothetical protein
MLISSSDTTPIPTPAAAAKYEKHTELKGHELKYDQAKCAAAKYEKHTELKDHESKYDQAKYAAGQHTQHPPSQYPLASVKSRKARQKGKHRANLNAHVKALKVSIVLDSTGIRSALKSLRPLFEQSRLSRIQFATSNFDVPSPNDLDIILAISVLSFDNRYPLGRKSSLEDRESSIGERACPAQGEGEGEGEGEGMRNELDVERQMKSGRDGSWKSGSERLWRWVR